MAAPYGAHLPPYLDILDVPAHGPLIPWACETRFFSLMHAHSSCTTSRDTTNAVCGEPAQLGDDEARADSTHSPGTRGM